MKKLLTIGIGIGMALSGCFAQSAPENTIIPGQKGKMIILNQATGLTAVHLTRNEKYVTMSFTSDEASSSMVYDIENDSFRTFGDVGMVEYVDDNNFVTSGYIMRNGQRVDLNIGNGAEGNSRIVLASSDLNTIAAFGYDQIGLYRNFIIDPATGQCIDTLPMHWTDSAVMSGGYGCMGLGMSNDGTVIAGRSSAPFSIINFSPVFWDLENDRSYFTGSTTIPNGSLYGCNNDGTIIVGDNGDNVVISFYDKEAGTVDTRTLYPTLGSSRCYAYDVSENGWVIGINQGGSQGGETEDIYSRVPYMYNIHSGLQYTMDEYLTDLYGLDVESTMPLFSPAGISDDARIIAGYSYQGGVWLPYVILLEEEQIHPRARYPQASQLNDEPIVNLSWSAPIEGQYTLAGYNVYRDSVLINTLALGAEETSFTDEGVESGVHSYHIEAIYTDGEKADWSEAVNIYLMAAGGCYPVQDISSSVVYNRTVNLSWGLPSAIVDNPQNIAKAKTLRDASSLVQHSAPASQPARKAAEKSYRSDTLDYVSLFNTIQTNASAAIRIDNYLYVSQFYSNVMYVFDVNTGILLNQVTIPGLPGIWDMEYRNGYFYCVNNSNTIYVISRNSAYDLQVSNSFTTMVSQLAHIAYVDESPEGDLLMTGSTHSILFYPLNPIDAYDTVDLGIEFDLSGLIIGGSTYYDGRIYLSDQDGENRCTIVTYDFNTGEKLFIYDAADYPEVENLTLASQGYTVLGSGMTVDTLEDGTALLHMMIQPLIANNHILTLEVASASDLVGYNVYRDGNLITSAPLQKRRLTDVLYDAGTYNYVVEVIKANSCTVKSDVVGVSESVVIYPIGECTAPNGVSAYESNEQVCLSWGDEVSDNFVGYNIYRDGEMICEHLLDLKYIDPEVEKGKTYSYRVEAFYDNSCVASDSTEIEVTFEGNAQAPSLVNVTAQKNADGTFNTTTTWDLPYFEEPMALGYCNQPMASISLSGASTLYGMIGWDTASMDLFDDLYLVGVEFIIGTEVTSINGVVMIDNAIVHSEPLTDRLRVGEWQRMFFNQTFPMKQEKEIVVGYSTTFNPDNLAAGVLVYDLGPGNPWYSDIVSPDGTNWYSLCEVSSQSGIALDANLCINALVVRKRDLENAAKSSDPIAYIQKVANSAGKLKITEPRMIENGMKTTSESFSLKGFNVYRDGEQLNTELLTSFSYEDANVALGGYDYSVGAVYENDTLISDPFYIDLADVANETNASEAGIHTYPNPVSNQLNIRGEYASLSVINLSGRVLIADIKDTKTLSTANWEAGIYLLQFQLENGQNCIVKIVKR